MGIKTSGKVMWKAINVSARELASIIVESKRKGSSQNESMPLRIDFDVSNLAHILYRSSKGTNSDDTILDVAKYLKQFAHETGFIVTAVLDGDN